MFESKNQGSLYIFFSIEITTIPYQTKILYLECFFLYLNVFIRTPKIGVRTLDSLVYVKERTF